MLCQIVRLFQKTVIWGSVWYLSSVINLHELNHLSHHHHISFLQLINLPSVSLTLCSHCDSDLNTIFEMNFYFTQQFLIRTGSPIHTSLGFSVVLTLCVLFVSLFPPFMRDVESLVLISYVTWWGVTLHWNKNYARARWSAFIVVLSTPLSLLLWHHQRVKLC